MLEIERGTQTQLNASGAADNRNVTARQAEHTAGTGRELP
jgi:hypothetical protein